MTFDGRLAIEEYGDDVSWVLLRPLTYTGESQSWAIPAGYVTDFASVPRAFEWKVRRFGRYTRAAIVHDYLITDELTKDEPAITSRDVDGVFRRIMREEGVPFATRWFMWLGVRLGAAFSTGARRHGLGLWRDLPAMVGIFLVALPLNIWGVAGVLISRALSWPVSR